MVKRLLLLLAVLVFGSANFLMARNYVYHFEDGTEGWTTIDADGDGFTWVLGSECENIYLNEGYSFAGMGYNGSNDMFVSGSYSNVEGPLTPDNFLVSPEKGMYTQIQFWACTMDTGFPEDHFGVAVSTTGNTDPADFTMIQEWDMTAKNSGAKRGVRGNRDQGTWYQYTVDLSAYDGQEIWLAIRHFDCGEDGSQISVDNVKVSFPDNTVAIDFETGDFSQYDFTNTSAHPWVIDTDGGNHYAKSGNSLVASSTSELSATHVFAEAGYIAFDFNCMGEGSSTFWDKCEFFIDGAQIFQHGADHQGWDFGLYEVAAGSHTFKWSYTKDSSVDPTGDYFAIDNIVFGEGDPCVAPLSVSAVGELGGATISWGGNAESFTLEYKTVASTTWTVVPNLTANTCTLTNLAAGEYDVRVQADCDEGNYATGTFTVYAPSISTANWYANACYAIGGEAWDGQFIHFTMQNINNITQANAGTLSDDVYAAAYANGYVWYILKNSGTLCRAILDNESHSIGTGIEVVEGFAAGTATEMSYNPVDGMMYFITSNNGSFLNKFDPTNPGAGATQLGTFEEHLYAFAINAEGVGYGMRNTGDLYTVDLTNATQTLVGSTGVECEYVQTMAFDYTTGELFWGQILDGSSHGLYRVNPTTAEAVRVGDLGSAGVELTGMFCAYGSTAPTTIADVMITDYSAPAYNAHPDFNLSVPAGAHYAIQSVNWYKGSAAMTSNDTFNDQNAEYHMSVVLTANDGYQFDNNAVVYFNGNSSVCASATLNSNGTLTAQTINYTVHDAVISDFEDSTFQGWTTIDADGDGYTWRLSSDAMGTGYGHTGSEVDMVFSQSYDNNYGPLTPDNYLVSPAKAAYGYIAFWACAQDSGYPSEHFGVSVSTTGNTSAADFTLVQEWTLSAKGVGAKSMGRGGETRDQGNWYKFEVDLSSFGGQDIYVAIRHFNCTDMFYIDVDDIELAMYNGVNENYTDVMSIYPNPAKDRMFVTSEVTVNEYRVYDVTGAEVMSNVVNNETFEVNVDNLPAGVYYIRIYSEGLIQTKKFVKE